jgi:ribosomal protein S18 acetylase RimI-like enzyme
VTGEDPVSVEIARAADNELIEAMRRLVPQLSPSVAPPTLEELVEILTSPATTLLVAREGRQIVGMLTLAMFRIPTGLRAWVEDVAVDVAARGKGVGERLSREALRLAAARGARTVELTSRPSREAANRLYQRIGFERRETNVYRYTVRGAG